MSYYLNSYYTQRLVNYSIGEQLWDLLPCLALTGVMGAVAYSLEWLSWTSNWPLLLSQIGVGAVVYLVLAYVFRLYAFQSILELFRTAVLAKAAR